MSTGQPLALIPGADQLAPSFHTAGNTLSGTLSDTLGGIHLTPSDADTAEEFVNKEVNFKAMCRTLTDPRYHERMQL